MARVSQARLVHKRQSGRRAPRLCLGKWMEQLENRLLRSVSGYSPIDEVGNNVANPNWGAAPADQPGGAAIQLLRLSPVAYADGISTPSLPYGGSNTSAPMPSPRVISNDVFNQSPSLYGSASTDINTVDGNGLSDFGYSFGQFMDHDMDLTLDQTGQPVPPGDAAADKDGDDGFPIPADTTNVATAGPDPIGSLEFSRSQYDPTTGTSTSNPRQQTTVVTAYLDLSQVYGSSLAVSNALRTGSGGQLKTSPGNMLPFNNATYFSPTAFDPDPNQLAELAMQNNGPLPNTSLYAAGDARANENTELTALTTLFVRNHNMIASQLQQQNPTWSDQQLFLEARKLNTAEYQNIIYTQYLPDLLGPSAMPAYTGYNANVNATISTEFSTIAFRFGHSMLNNTVERDANSGSSVGNVPLGEDFFDPNLVNPSGAIDPFTGLAGTDIGAFLKGDADSASQAVDSMAVSSVRDDLFGNGVPGGEDLISRDIWRSRDDGIGTYNQVRVAFGLAPITDDATFGFDQITSNVTVQHELENAYAKVIAGGGFAGDIDPFVGGMAEDHVSGSDMGPLFTTILANQFTRLQTGDQYYYLNESFTPAEQAILNQGKTLGQIITAGTGVTNLQADVFKFASTGILLVNSNGNNALDVTGGSSVDVYEGGTVIIDSSNKTAATISGGSDVSAGEIEVDGGDTVNGGSAVSQPVVHTGPTADPLSLPLPPIPANSFSATHIEGGRTTTLSPGEYIGGINVSNGSNVTLSPGIYYLQGGGFTVTGGSTVSGNGVLLVNAAGSNPGSINVSNGSTLSLSAPTTLAGSLAPYNGIAIMQDLSDSNAINLSGGSSIMLIGTLFAAGSVLSVSGGSQFSDAGTFGIAAIILSELDVTGGSNVTVTF